MRRQQLARVLWATATALLAACSIELTDGTPVPTVEVPVIRATEAGTAGPPPTSDGDWMTLGLSGRLIFTRGAEGLLQMDLASGDVQPLFTPPADTWLTGVTAAPDNRLALAYSPPPAEGEPQLGYTGLYTLPGDCETRPDGCTAADIAPLLVPGQEHEAYFSPVWAPDGETLYFVHFTPSSGETNTPFRYTLSRLRLPDGQPEPLVEHAFWPAVSADGSQIAYVWSDPEDYSNHLFVAAADGSNPREVVDPLLFSAVDSPLFSPDGERLLFSAVGEGKPQPTPAALAWLQALVGVGTAAAAPEAHNVPSDWWQVPVAGGAPERLTQIYDTGLYGDFSPDGRFLAFVGGSGLRVMATEGGGLTPLLEITGAGTLEWIR